MLDEKNLPVYFAKRQQMRQRGLVVQVPQKEAENATVRDWGEEDMVESFREYGKAMNAFS